MTCKELTGRRKEQLIYVQGALSERRKYVTLIAAFRSRAAIAVCADSQETITCYDEHGTSYELRKTVQKISPHVIGKYQIAIAGAGNANLIESFVIRAVRA